MITTTGQIYDILPDGRALIASPLPDKADENDVRLIWYEADHITSDQRAKIFAINREIAEWAAYKPEETRKILTYDFLRQNIEQLQLSSLSLAVSGNCDKGTASLFIEFLINFCLENNVPTKVPLGEYAEDLERYTYAALMHKRCIVCGKAADLHHVDAIGMGYNRKTKAQIGDRIMPLCRLHHTELHSIGEKRFCEQYHAVPVRMDKRIADRYGITGKAATLSTKARQQGYTEEEFA